MAELGFRMTMKWWAIWKKRGISVTKLDLSLHTYIKKIPSKTWRIINRRTNLYHWLDWGILSNAVIFKTDVIKAQEHLFCFGFCWYSRVKFCIGYTKKGVTPELEGDADYFGKGSWNSIIISLQKMAFIRGKHYRKMSLLSVESLPDIRKGRALCA